MRDLFEEAFQEVLQDEGEYSYDPEDPGGETKWGITWREWIRSGRTEEEWDELTLEEATEWYREHFWTRYNFDRIKHSRIAKALFNIGVNIGPVLTIRMAQRAINKLRVKKIAEDGILGPVTARAINEYRHPGAFMMAWKDHVCRHYFRVANPKFLAGWLNRLDRL